MKMVCVIGYPSRENDHASGGLDGWRDDVDAALARQFRGSRAIPADLLGVAGDPA